MELHHYHLAFCYYPFCYAARQALNEVNKKPTNINTAMISSVHALHMRRPVFGLHPKITIKVERRAWISVSIARMEAFAGCILVADARTMPSLSSVGLKIGCPLPLIPGVAMKAAHACLSRVLVSLEQQSTMPRSLSTVATTYLASFTALAISSQELRSRTI